MIRIQSVVTYQSSSGGQSYYFDIVVDAQGQVSVRNVRGPRGLISDPFTTLPSSVVSDIYQAEAIVSQAMVETEVTHGSVNFTGQSYKDINIAAGLLNNTNYRVIYSTTDGIVLYTENKATTSFRATVGSSYGSIAVPKPVVYSVMVSTHQGSTVGGVLTFTDADAGEKSVAFTTAMLSADYRVVLSPDGFFYAYVITQTKTGFTVQLGYTLDVGEIVTVGFDVFL